MVLPIEPTLLSFSFASLKLDVNFPAVLPYRNCTGVEYVCILVSLCRIFIVVLLVVKMKGFFLKVYLSSKVI